VAGDRVRIAYVIGELGKGGAEYQLYELVRGLDRTRFLPHVFVLSAGGYWAGPLRALGVEVDELPSVRSAELARLVALRRALGAFAPHVVHTVLWSGNAYGRLASIGLGIPVVVAAERNVIRRPRWQVMVERTLDLVTDRYLVNAAAVVDELTGPGGLPHAKMEVIPNGIDLGGLPPFAIERGEARRALGFDPQRRLVAQVGRLEPQKDYPTFLAAAARVAARVADVDFLAVGEGALRAELEAQAAQLGLAGRLRFTGLRHDVPALLGAVDVCVLASRYEGLPNVVIEAMSAGAVVVATDVGGTRDLVVPGESGHLVRAGDVDAVAAATLAILGDAAQARAMALAARRRIESGFTVEAMVRRTTAAYDDLLRRAGVGAGVLHAA
jgi:glycosyltransferase involved in cell wall biosynthesis